MAKQTEPMTEQQASPGRQERKESGLGLGCILFVVLGFGGIMFLGVLASIAIPAYLKYLRRSQASEAAIYVRRLEQSVLNAHETRNASAGAALTFPCAGRGWICAPKAKLCSQGKAYVSRASDWSDACWKELRFEMKGKHYFQYCYRAQGKGVKATFTVEARGDLDCDGTLGTFRVKGHVDPSTQQPKTSPLQVFDGFE